MIVGFTRDRGVKQRLWDYLDVKGEPVEINIDEGINAYLIDGPQVLVKSGRNHSHSFHAPGSDQNQPMVGT